MVAADASTVSLYQQLWQPLSDALLRRGPNASALRRHAWTFYGARAAAKADQAAAAKFGFVSDDEWTMRHALTSALDRRDDWVGVLGSARRLSEDVVVTGHWPRSPFIALGTHWGAGMPTLAHLCVEGLKPRFVYRQEPASVWPSSAAKAAHRLHLQAIDRFGGSIRVGGAYTQIMSSLAAGATPVILMDAPAEGRPTLEGRGHRLRLQVRSGLLEMLCREQIRYAFYRCGFDPASGRRHLDIGPEHDPQTPQAIADQAALHLEQALMTDSAQWRLWMVARGLLAVSSV